MKKILRKKGFTLIELVIVVAIIGIILAMVLPNLSTSEANKKAALSASKDFYSAAQYMMTKYSRFEGYISDEMKQQQLGNDPKNLKDDCILNYDKALFGNYPAHTYIMISMVVRQSRIVYVDAVSYDSIADCEREIFQQNGVKTEGGNYVLTPFERAFAQDIDPLFEQQDGVYYAIIRSEGVTVSVLDDTSTNPCMRVLAAAYCVDELPIAPADFESYKQSTLLFNENFRLANGYYMGVCSSQRIAGKYIGTQSSYFSLVEP